jgi:hypothetical protein
VSFARRRQVVGIEQRAAASISMNGVVPDLGADPLERSPISPVALGITGSLDGFVGRSQTTGPVALGDQSEVPH